MENVVSVVFEVESEAYQAFSEVKSAGFVTDDYTLSEMDLVKVKDGTIEVADRFDSGVQTVDDTVLGGLVGGLVGIIGGPVGMLLGGSLGVLSGSTLDVLDEGRNLSLIELTSSKLFEGETVIVALVQEDDEAAFDALFEGFKTTIVRQDAADVEEQVEQMVDLQRETERIARETVRKERSEERKARVDSFKSDIKARFAQIGNSVKDVFDGDKDGDGSWRDQ